MALSLPYPNIKAGDSIIAAELKLNFAALATEVNGNLDTNSLKANAGIVDTQLAQISTPGKVSGAALTGAIAIGSLGAAMDAITAGLLISGAGSAVTAGLAEGCIPVPFTGTITGVSVYGDKTGSCVLDLWKDTTANFPPTVADTITASAKPTISSAKTYADTTLTGWTKSVTAGDVIYVNVDSAATMTWIVVALKFTRTA